MTIAEGYLTISEFSPSDSGVAHFFGTRFAPRQWVTDSEIGWVNQGPKEWPVVVAVKQVHGTDVLIVDQFLPIGKSLSEECDAIVTNQPEVLVTVRTADCVPVLLYDHTHQVVAAVHAGWRGAVKGIVPKVLGVLKDQFRCSPHTIQVAIGPSAGVCCYEVDQPVLLALQNIGMVRESIVEQKTSDRGLLNLKHLNRVQAIEAGVPASNIFILDVCTICRPDLFFSYRREGDQRGTMVSGIMLTTLPEAA